MAKKKGISHTERNSLTLEDLKRYEAGNMTSEEMHRVEKILLEQPFYAAAAEGLLTIQKDKVSTEKNSAELKARLEKRISQNPVKPTPVLKFTKIWKPVSIAAALIFIFAGGFFLINNKQKEGTTAININSQQNIDKLSEPATAPLLSVPEQDYKALPKPETTPIAGIEEKRKIGNQNQQQVIVREAEAPAGIERNEAIIAAQKSAVDRTTEKISLPVAASAPIVAEKKTDASDKEENNHMAGASRMSRSVVSGMVVDEDNEPMKDVTVNIRGKWDGVRTDEEGRFNLRDAKKGDILVFNSLTLPQMEVPFKNSLFGKIVYSEQNIKLPIKPKISVSSPNEIMFEKVSADARPEFGWEAFDIYLKENTKRPPKALEANIRGRVIVSFTINEKGELADFTIIRSLGFGCDEEAIRIIKNGPRWFPATKDDAPVVSSRQVIIRFQ